MFSNYDSDCALKNMEVLTRSMCYIYTVVGLLFFCVFDGFIEYIYCPNWYMCDGKYSSPDFELKLFLWNLRFQWNGAKGHYSRFTWLELPQLFNVWFLYDPHQIWYACSLADSSDCFYKYLIFQKTYFCRTLFGALYHLRFKQIFHGFGIIVYVYRN